MILDNTLYQYNNYYDMSLCCREASDSGTVDTTSGDPTSADATTTTEQYDFLWKWIIWITTKNRQKKIFVCLHYIYKNDSKWTVPLFQSPQIKKIAIIFMQNVCIWFFFTIWMFWVWIKGYMRQPSTSQYDLKQWLKQALYRKL